MPNKSIGFLAMQSVVFALGLLAFWPGSVAHAETYYVAKNGSNARSCAEAKNQNTPRQTIMGASGGMRCLTTPGDRLVIRAGNYREDVSNFENGAYFAPSGTSWDNAFTVQAFEGERVDVRSIFLPTKGDDDPAVCLFHTKSLFAYWIFDGINVDYGPGAREEPIWMRCPNHIRFKNIEVNAYSAPTTCIMGGGHHIEFSNMDIHHCGDPDVCDVSAIDGHCIRRYATYLNVDDLLIDRSKIHDIRNYGLHLFRHNCNETTSNCPDRNVVSNSLFWNVTQDPLQWGSAILLSGGDGHRAVNNVIYSVGGTAIDVSFGARDVKLMSNTVYSAKGAGIAVSSKYGRRGVENVFIANNLISQSQSWGVIIAHTGASWGTPSNVKLYNNLLFGNASGAIFDQGAGTVKEMTLSQDPRFVNVAAKNFRLQSGSPAINSGYNLGTQLNIDIEGRARPAGGKFDIGAYEYGATANPQAPLSFVVE